MNLPPELSHNCNIRCSDEQHWILTYSSHDTPVGIIGSINRDFRTIGYQGRVTDVERAYEALPPSQLPRGAVAIIAGCVVDNPPMKDSLIPWLVCVDINPGH